jgi:hypothetical protein
MLRMNELTFPVAGYDAAGDHGSAVKRARELSLPCSRKGMRAAPPSGLVILPPVPAPTTPREDFRMLREVLHLARQEEEEEARRAAEVGRIGNGGNAMQTRPQILSERERVELLSLTPAGRPPLASPGR